MSRSSVDYNGTLWYIITMSKGVLNLRGIPTDVIRRAKSAAALQGITLREWVLKAIEERLKRVK
jgi:predicted HicB family RNase H-like nuclease